MGKLIRGPLTRTGAGSSIREASPDDPIYTRGYSIGGFYSARTSRKDAESDIVPDRTEESPADDTTDEQ